VFEQSMGSATANKKTSCYLRMACETFSSCMGK